MDTPDVLQAGVNIRPELSLDEAQQLAEDLYNLEVEQVKELNSYDDRNFLIKIKTSEHHAGYVLKILNSMDSKKTHVESEHEMLECLSAHNFKCPVPIKNKYGETLRRMKLKDDGPAHIVRLLSFLPGRILQEARYTPALLHELGLYLGRLHTCVNDHMKVPEVFRAHKTVWDLTSVPMLRDFTYVLSDVTDKSLMHDIVERFEREVVAVLDQLPAGIVHGDVNEQNIIVTEVGQHNNNAPRHKISGIIDFGDANFCPLVFDIAIAVMYTMVDSDVIDPLDVGGHVVAGYELSRSLSELEWRLLPLCVAARFAQSLTLGAYTLSQDPGNDYVVVTSKRGWPMIRGFWKLSMRELETRWRDTVHTYPQK